MANRPGGWSETLPADEDIQRICDEVKPQVEEKTKKKYGTFRAVEYRNQVVAGMNYLIKVHVGSDNYLIIEVFQNLPCNGGKSEVKRVEEGHHKDDPIIIPKGI